MAFAVVLTFVFMLSCVSDDSSADAYWYDSEEDILNVTSDISDFDESDDRGWDPYLSSAKSIVVHEGVRSVGDYAFHGMDNVTRISLPSTLEDLGTCSFADCVRLTDLSFGSDVVCEKDAFLNAGTLGAGVSVVYLDMVSEVNRPFWGTENVRSVDLGKVTSIGDMAFYGSEGVEFTIPSTVTYFGDLAMYGCTGLEELVLGKDLTHIGVDAFKGCLALTDVTFLAERCDDLTGGVFGDTGADMSFTIGAPCSYIPSYLFEGADLDSLTVADTVTSIGKHAFLNFSGPEVILPHGLEDIGDEAFMGCKSLRAITLSGSLTSIGSGAFKGCTSLTDVVFFAQIGDVPKDKVFFSNIGSSDLEVTVTGIDRVPANLFFGCSDLTSVIFGDSVVTIGESAFESCASLASVDLSGVMTVEDNAFKACVSLSDVRFSESESHFGHMAFYGCSVSSIVLPDAILDGSVFEGNSLLSVKFNGSLECTGDPFPGMSGTTFTFMDGDISLDPASIFSECDDILLKFLSDSIPEVLFQSFIGEFSLEIASKHIGDRAFRGCINLNSLSLKDTVESIGEGSFSGCSSIVSLIVPASVTELGPSAFSYLASLSYVEYRASSVTVHLGDEPFIGSGVADGFSLKVIGDVPGRIFSGSPSPKVSDVELIGTAVIGDHAFHNSCMGEISLPYCIVSIGEYAFANTDISEIVLVPGSYLLEGVFSGCDRLVSIDLTGFTRIPDRTFDGCTSLENVLFDRDLESIGEAAFSGTSLSSLQFPCSLSLIGEDAFRNCPHLEHLTLLGHDVSIGDGAFVDCPLDIVEMQAGTALGEDVFTLGADSRVLMSGCPSGTILSGCIVYSGQGQGGGIIEYDISTLGLSAVLLFDDTVLDVGLLHSPESEFIGWMGEDGDRYDSLSGVGEITVHGSWVGAEYEAPEEPSLDPRIFDILAWIFMLASFICIVLSSMTKRAS